jgi:subtilisin-like proprotein convertase family protein
MRFDWSPSLNNLFDSYFISPALDTSTVDAISISFDRLFNYYSGATAPVSLGVYVIVDSANPIGSITTADTFIPLWTLSATANLPSERVAFNALKPQFNANYVYVALRVSSTRSYNLDEFEVDNFKVCKGRAPAFTEYPAEIGATLGQTVTHTVVAMDPDTYTGGSLVDDTLTFSIVEGPSFVSLGNTTYHWFYQHWRVPLIVKPTNPSQLGVHNVVIEVSDGCTTRLITIPVTVLIDSGYVVWTPGSTPPSHATALFNAISANGRMVQQVKDLSVFPSLNNLDGIFVVTGVYGAKAVLTNTMVSRLVSYLDQGGKIYMEGGDTWSFDSWTNLHPYFKVTALDDGEQMYAGPLEGRNFLFGRTYGVKSGPGDYQFNNFLDYISSTTNSGSIPVMWNGGIDTFAMTVVFEHGTKNYRTIGSSVPFSALVGTPGATLDDLMGRYLDFLENGYPPCQVDQECWDGVQCTLDRCMDNVCSQTAIPNCIPCGDDGDCPATHACRISNQICVEIPGIRYDSEDTPINISSGSTGTYTSVISVPDTTLINDINVKVRIQHAYRGDLRVSLARPGKSVVLKSTEPVDNATLLLLTYDFGTDIWTGSAFGLNDFNGEAMVGDWTLVVEDLAAGAGGVLVDWSLFIVTQAVPCTQTAQCNDGNVCTIDVCNVDLGYCNFLENTCEDYDGSHPNLCTEDSCDLDLGCLNVARDCDDGNLCTIDSCDTLTGDCVNTLIPNCVVPCTSHKQCGYNDYCDKVAQLCKPIPGVPYQASGAFPLSIPDNTLDPMETTINITNPGLIRAVHVKVMISHPHSGDLTVTLTKDATVLYLHNKSGGAQDNVYRVYEISESSDDADSLGVFTGRYASGNWVLKVHDWVAGDSGTLDRWSVHVEEVVCYTNEDCDDANACTIDICDSSIEGGACVYTNIECDDGAFCNGVEFCLPDIGCQSGAAPEVDDGVACTADLCVEGNPAQILHTPVNALCSDGVWCNGAEICQASFGCLPGTPQGVDDGIDCTYDWCDEEGKMVQHEPQHWFCQDGLWCNGDEICDPSQGCVNGFPPDTSDGIACTVDSCDESTRRMVHAVDHAFCDNGVWCDGFEQCHFELDCIAGNPPAALDDGVVCTRDICHEDTRILERIPDDSLCDDGLFCNGLEMCHPFEGCQPGVAVPVDDYINCTLDRCDEDLGMVVHAPNHDQCDDGNPCTTGVCGLGGGVGGCSFVFNSDPCDLDELCTVNDFCSQGVCMPGGHNIHEPLCSNCNENGCPDDGNLCNGSLYCETATSLCRLVPGSVVNCPAPGNLCESSVCDPATGICVIEPKGTEAACDDGDPCTLNDRCDGAAACAGTVSACDNGLFCDGLETCHPVTGACSPGEPPLVDDGIACTIDFCDEINDVVVHVANHLACSDSLFCNGEEVCDPARGCVAGEAPVLDDGVQCTVDTCNEALNFVENTPDHDRCDDGVFCNGRELCSALNGCYVTEVPQLDDGVMCTNDWCDEDAEVVRHTPVHAFCDNGDDCDGLEFCDIVLDCQPGVPPVVDDGIGCTLDSCINGVLYNIPDNSLCDDGLFCNGAETCNAVAGCMSGVPPQVDDGVACTVDYCDEANDVVVNLVNDNRCNDGLYCNGAEYCDPVQGCQSGAAPACDDSDPCTQNLCDPALNGGIGACDNSLRVQHCVNSCGGLHAFDAGDNQCGYDDACVGGLAGPAAGTCTAVCNLSGNCAKGESGLINTPINDNQCIYKSVTIAPQHAFVMAAYVKVEILHTHLADLSMTLRSPQNAVISLWAQGTGQDKDHMYNTFTLSYPNIPGDFCSLLGQNAAGSWTIEICDHSAGNVGKLIAWKMFVESTPQNLSKGDTCEAPIPMSSANGTAGYPGTTYCANDFYSSSCGGGGSFDRVYRFTTTVPKRITARLSSAFDAMVYLKESEGATCKSDTFGCVDACEGDACVETLTRRLMNPGTYYLFVDGAGGQKGGYQLDVDFFELLANGDACTAASECLSNYCNNGFCCNEGSCCVIPGNCPIIFSAPPICDDVGGCQGHRVDATCISNQCGSLVVEDDSGCAGEVAASCGCYLPVMCTNAVVQTAGSCSTACTQDVHCASECHCEPSGCQPDVPDGGPCQWNSQCASGHCNNGICCAAGECCLQPTGCPASYQHSPVCDSVATCQGHRAERVCINFQCGSVDIEDDRACFNRLVASECGCYPKVMCSGAANQVPPQCQVGCALDGECDPGCHCEPLGEGCVPDRPNGDPCSKNSDCISQHCENGFCCDVGTCCNVAGSCPAEFSEAPSCNDTATCQGTRVDATCLNSQCGSVQVNDDSSCTAETLALNCGLYSDEYCTGELDQLPPKCNTSCATDADCLPTAFCHEGQCYLKLPNGSECYKGSQCISEHCQNGFCCDDGDCCVVPEHCPAQYYVPPVCDDPEHCQGFRMDKRCDNFICDNTPIPDDSGCTTATVANECGCYTPVYCSGQVAQGTPLCPIACTGHGQCDINCHCDSECVPNLENGLPCDQNTDCYSLHCVDGVCCDSGCGRPCEACDIAGKEGTCSPFGLNTDPSGECGMCGVCNGASACMMVPDGQDPIGACSEMAASSCLRDGTCNGAGQCRLWVAGTECVASVCLDGFHQPADHCNGTGQCLDAGIFSCSPYACNAAGTQCRTECTTSTDCFTGFWCGPAGTCIPKKVNAAQCNPGLAYDGFENPNVQCQSNFCVDGRCCNTACNGECMGCAVIGKLGVCTFFAPNSDPDNDCPLCKVCNGGGSCAKVPAGADPLNECATTSQDTCGLDGTCDGEAACRFWLPATVCVQQSCMSPPEGSGMLDYQFNTDMCDGAGTCVDNDTTACYPFRCDGDWGCFTACYNNTQCAPDSFCRGTMCYLKKDNGETCSGAAFGWECKSELCVDGVCCDTACNGTCESCAQAGSQGACTPYVLDSDPEAECGHCGVCSGVSACQFTVEGTDPLHHCAAAGPETCAQDGTCDGSGQCRLHVPNTVCVPQWCVNAEVHTAWLCDGIGTCHEQDIYSCSPYICNALGESCRTHCEANAHCLPGFWCDGNQQCVPVYDNGTPCLHGYQCASDHCVDGFCCDTACDTICHSCALNPGVCTAYAAGTDPEDDCALCYACNPGGSQCVLVTFGLDPKQECEGEGPFTCQLDGGCDGAGTCHYWAVGTECSTQYCDAGIMYPIDSCNGTGTCIDAGIVVCEPYACDGVGFDCRTMCSEQFHCHTSYWCNLFPEYGADLKCKPKVSLGGTCSRNEQCFSSFCVDGVCCNGPCQGECKACNVAGSVGSCVIFGNDTDPEEECGLCRVCNGAGACKSATEGTDLKEECTQTSEESCGHDGVCNGAAACRFWSTDTACVEKTCVNFTFFPTDYCNAAGNCIDSGQVDCSPYMCNDIGTGCRTICLEQSHCIDGFWCNSINECVVKKVNGTVCSADFECHSEECIDGVCCDRGCDGVCESCTLNWAAPHIVNPNGNLSEWLQPAQKLGDGPNGVGFLTTWNETYFYLAVSNADVAAGGLNIYVDKDPAPNPASGSAASPTGDTFAGKALPDYFISVTAAGVSLYTYNNAGQTWGTPANKNAWQRYIGFSGNKTTELRIPLAELPGMSPADGLRLWMSVYRSADGAVVTTWPSRTGPLGTIPVAFTNAQFIKYGAGMCKPHGFYTDPEFECGNCRVCDGNAACMLANNGDDPKENCAWSDPSTCGQDGVCDGAGLCRLWALGTICVEQTCVGHFRHPADRCNGTGLCIDTPVQNCAPYVCHEDGQDCRYGCDLDAHCQNTHYCLEHVCVLKKTNGVTCGGGRECASGFCTDGVCCNLACGGICEACNKIGTVGTCTLHAPNSDPEDDCPICQVCTGTGNVCVVVSNNQDPVNDCAQEGESTCQKDGVCNGAGACRLWAAGTLCLEQYCDQATQHYRDLCNGLGVCSDGGTLSCAPYQCNAAGYECRTDCGEDAHCVVGYFCNASSQCQQKFPVGSPCTAPNQCQSTFCVDGFCCDQACSANCMACNYPGQQGTCKYWDNDTDPDVECGLCGVCNGAGLCRPAASGTDPKSECTQAAEDTCDFDGFCDGAYACRFWNTNTVCVEQTCVVNTKYPTDYCSGDGSCVDSGEVNCEPYVCNNDGNECLFACTVDVHCMAAYWCDGSSCEPKKANGIACSGHNECISDSCVDGVCCNTLCDGTCENCALEGKLGTCSYYVDNIDDELECGLCRVCNGSGACRVVLSGLDPLSQCAMDTPGSCDLDGTCDGAGACRLWQDATVCVDQVCIGQSMYPADYCDGIGDCLDSGTVDCVPYVCALDGVNCRDACSSDAHCQSLFWCQGAECSPKKNTGDPCVGANECLSNFCADGFCCNEACDRTCESCAVTAGTCVIHSIWTDPDSECPLCTACGGANSCINVLDGLDPLADCPTDPEATCQRDGVCDGSGSCRLWEASTECVLQFCSDGFEHAADVCDGLGNCLDSGTTACTPYVCDGAGFACRHSCTLNEHCVGTHWCQANVCVPKKALGETCVESFECSSNQCADGVCCSTSCDGLCRACNLPGSMGTCTFFTVDTDPFIECPSCQQCNGAGACKNVLAGLDPKDNCAGFDVSTCHQDGTCNGAGACRLWINTTVCKPQSCTLSTLFPTEYCSGTGTCVAQASYSCCPFMCDTDACRNTCSADPQCCSNSYCDGSACQFKMSDGNACTRGGQCQSGNCVDGYCCNTACTGECRSCAVAGFLGVCRNFTSNTDPEIECGKCRVCNGAGACKMQSTSQDVKNECEQSIESTCGLNGYCNGTGNCAYWVSSTVCVSQTCLGTTLYPADYCSGAGACVDSPQQSCYPYACNGEATACNTGCGADFQCHPDAWCFSGNCVPKKALGQTCTGANQCLSGQCVDGYCCNTACNAACESCSTNPGTCSFHPLGSDPENNCPLCWSCSGTNNSCVLVPTGTDPANDCDGTSETTCGLDGTCDGSGACRLWPNATVCLPQYCLASVRYLSDLCNGTGTCIDQGTQSCNGYACNAAGTDCRTACSEDGHCSEGFWCNTGVSQCQPKKADGQNCGGGNQCLSSFCTDGVCCNAPCGGTCKACNVAGSVGACTNVPNDTDPDFECGLCSVCSGGGFCKSSTFGTDIKNQCSEMPVSGCGFTGTCDGSGACELWPWGSVCIAQYCVGSTLNRDDECDGLGTCQDKGTQSCSPYRCADAVMCRTSCSDDAHCVTGFYCAGSTCVAKKANGQTCSGANECSSSFCVDGYCCNSTCTGSCRACNVAGSLGSCSYYGDTTDPEAECGLCKVCNGLGACRNANEGTDLKNQCAAASESTCGLDGFCNGLGACRKWPGGTVCQTQACSGTDRTATAYCDGDGSCVAAASSCESLGWSYLNGSPWVCGQSSPCNSSATFVQAKAHCASMGGRLCTWQEIVDGEVKGTGCGFDSQRIWSLSECAENSHYTGAGDPANLGSVPQQCTGDALLAAVRCCSDFDSCCPYRCVGNGCGTTCAGNGDCCSGYYCSGGQCLAQLNFGDTCTHADQCLSGNCVDGYCCNSACAGACEACNLTGHLGECWPHPDNTDPEDNCGTCLVCNGNRACRFAANGTDPANDCLLDSQSTCQRDGQCNGAGVCRLWDASTTCTTQTCSDFTLHTADFCNGTGLCFDSGTTSCCPYKCNAGATACRTSCTADTQCCSDAYCGNPSCLPKKTNGTVCSGANQCLSGNCVDGVCCNTACGSLCQACNVAGSVGTCTNFANNTDPMDECPTCQICNGAAACVNVGAGLDPSNHCTESLPSTCGLDGTCSGSGACRRWINSTVCVAASCTGSTYYKPDYCNGTGSCVDAGTQSCCPYMCGATSCLGSCSAHSQCCTDSYCSGASCVPKKANGSTCSAAAECSSGRCVDGYCCNTNCTGACEACNVAGALGTCTRHLANSDPEGECSTCGVCNGSGACVFVATGSDPLNQCTQQTMESCGTDGTCNGSGACRLWNSSTVCVTQSCTTSTKQPTGYCNGTGACAPPATVNCSPYLCSGNDCRTNCTGDEHCVTNYYCASGVCVAKKTNGNTCGAANQCVSNFCVDGYCCENACTGTCWACNVAGFLGQCRLHTVNTDPDNECTTCMVCSGSGTCTNVANGADPTNDCSEQAPCGRDGQCNGSGVCRLWNAATVCAAQSCSGTTLYKTDYCNGTGTCVDAGTQACDPYVCGAGACRTNCGADGDCVVGYYCSASTCVAKKALGQVCGGGNQCLSGRCVDGVCCDGDCTGTCRACNLAGSVGTCTFVPNNTDPAPAECGLCKVCDGAGACKNATNGADPKNECTGTPSSSCGHDGECNGSGACRYWSSVYTCGSQSCTGSTYTPAPLCNGLGSCTAQATSSCCPHACNTTGTCRTSCTADGECCTATAYCNGSACVNKKTNGQTCGRAAECSSNNCVDGYCCNTACTGECRACNVAGALGTCTNFASGTDPVPECGTCRMCNGSGACTNVASGGAPMVASQCVAEAQSTCGRTGTCNGSGGCALWNSSTICVAQTCSDYLRYPADYCNGSGSCIDSGSISCCPYTCTGASCRTGCSDDSHCCTGNYCGGGTCQAKKANGTGCGAPNECSSGFCVDGVCCNNACTGDCKACNRAGTVGTCSNHSVNTDPESNCGTCRACNGAGACAPVANGTDPLGQCAQAAASTCGQDGECNGSGGCRLWGSGTVCVSQTCASTTHQDSARTCNGTGTCLAATQTACSPYICSGTACRTNCTSDSHVQSGYMCYSNQVATACTAPGSCVSGQRCCLSDTCASYVTIPIAYGTKTYYSSTYGSTNSYNYDGSALWGASSPDRVFRLNTNAGDGVGVIADISVSGNFNTVLYVRYGTCGATTTAFDANDDGCGLANGGSCFQNLQMPANRDYWIYVDGKNGALGDFTLTVTIKNPCGNCACDTGIGENTTNSPDECRGQQPLKADFCGNVAKVDLHAGLLESAQACYWGGGGHGTSQICRHWTTTINLASYANEFNPFLHYQVVVDYGSSWYYADASHASWSAGGVPGSNRDAVFQIQLHETAYGAFHAYKSGGTGWSPDMEVTLLMRANGACPGTSYIHRAIGWTHTWMGWHPSFGGTLWWMGAATYYLFVDTARSNTTLSTSNIGLYFHTYRAQ